MVSPHAFYRSAFLLQELTGFLERVWPNLLVLPVREPKTFTATTQLLARAVGGHVWLFSFQTQSRSTPHGMRGWLYYSSSFPAPSSKPSFTPSPAPPSEVRKLLSRHSYSWVLDTIGVTWSRRAPRMSESGS